MYALVQTDKYGVNNETDTTITCYYEIKLIPETYTLQQETTYNGKISTDDELVAKAQ